MEMECVLTADAQQLCCSYQFVLLMMAQSPVKEGAVEEFKIAVSLGMNS